MRLALECGVVNQHAMLGQLSGLGQIKIASWYDSIGIDVGTVFVNVPF